MSYCLRKCLKLYVSQTRKLSRYLLVMVNVSSNRLIFILTSIASQDLLQCLKSLFRLHNGSFLSYSKKKGKLVKMTTLCLLLSLVVSHCTTRCHLLYHPLSFVVTRCHLLSLVVPLVVTRCITCLSFFEQSKMTVSPKRL